MEKNLLKVLWVLSSVFVMYSCEEQFSFNQELLTTPVVTDFPEAFMATTTTIVDNNNSNKLSQSTGWKLETNGGYQRSYLQNTQGAGFVTFKPTIPSGMYQIFLYWKGCSLCATNTKVQMNTSVGQVEKLVNQKNMGDWFDIGTFQFSEPPRVSIVADSTNGNVQADAVKFVAISDPAEPPLNVTWLATWDYADGLSTNANGITVINDGELNKWGTGELNLVEDPQAQDGKAIRMALPYSIQHYRSELAMMSKAVAAHAGMEALFYASMGNAFARMDVPIVYQVSIKITQNWAFDRKVNSLDECCSLFEFKQDRASASRKDLADATFRVRIRGNQYNLIFKATEDEPTQNSNGDWVYTDKNIIQTAPIEPGDIENYVLWTVEVIWSTSDNGYLRVYKGDKLLFEKTGFTSRKTPFWGPYEKSGLYDACYKAGYPMRTNVGHYREVYQDFRRVGKPK